MGIFALIGKRSKQRKYIIDEDTRRSKPSFEKENIYLVQQPTYYVTSRHPHHRRKKNKKKPYKSRQFYDEEVYPSFVTNSSRHNKVRQRYHDLGKRDDFDEVMIIDDSRVLANSHQRNKDVFVIVDDGLSSNRRSYSENYAANDKEIHFFNDHHLDRVEDIGYGRRETFGDPIHSNVGYNNQSYIVDERRWNLPKVPRSSISKEEYSTWHCQARSADYQAYMDSRENDESKFIGVINQPPLQKKYCRSSSSQKTSHSHLQDDEEFLQEGDSRVLSVLSQHPQRQNRDYVKWQTISDAPKIVEDAVHTNSQHSNQSMMMENKIVKSTLQEFDRETDLKSNVSPPSPSLYAVVRKTDNNFKNDKIHHNKRESRMHQNRSTTNDGSNETTTTTTTKSMKMRTVGDIGHPEDRKISQTSSTTTTAQKVSHVKQPVAEKIQSSHQESYTGHQSWEKRILQKKSSKVEEELKAWMDLQRKESDLNRYNINQSILTQSVLMNGEEQPNPTRRSRVDTLTIVPQNDTLVGSYNTENYVDATDNVSPKNGAIQPNNIRNEPYFAEDFVNKPDTSKREKRKSPGFFGRLKNKLSSNPKSNEQQEEDEDDSGEEEEYWEKPKKCLGK